MNGPLPDANSAAPSAQVNQQTAQDPWGWTWGAALLVIALTFALWSLLIEAPRVGGEHDLGPRAFPWLLCLGLALCGAYELAHHAGIGWRLRGVEAADKPDASRDNQRLQWRQVLFAAIAVTICLLAIGALHAPYSVATFGLAVALMRQQGASWMASLFGAFLLVVWIKLMFGWGFGVQLEDGWIDRLAFRMRVAS